MGLLGSGEGTLGLGGTKYDPRTWSAGGKSLADYGVDMTGSYNFDFQSVLHDYVAQLQAGAEQAAATTTANVEGIIEDNNDSLADLESGINTSIADGVDNLETNIEGGANLADSGVSLINMGGDIIAQGLDASVNTNNPDSLVVNPQSWWDKNKEGAARGDWFFNSDEVSDTMAEKGGGILKDAFQPQYDWMSEGVSGVASTFVGIGESLGSQFLRGGKTGLEGDPFGMEGPRRRDILEKKTFKDRGGATAPSRINQGGYV